MFSCLRRIQKHFHGGAPNFDTYFKRSFSLRNILKCIEHEKDSRGSCGMLLQQYFSGFGRDLVNKTTVLNLVKTEEF